MNTITFVSLHAKEDKNDDVVFLIFNLVFYLSK